MAPNTMKKAAMPGVDELTTTSSEPEEVVREATYRHKHSCDALNNLQRQIGVLDHFINNLSVKGDDAVGMPNLRQDDIPTLSNFLFSHPDQLEELEKQICIIIEKLQAIVLV